MPSQPTLTSFECIETFFATLYRSESEVYKVRRPIALTLGDERVDLTSLESRLAACREEERVDRRLAPGVAHGVVPVTRDRAGVLRFEGAGETVDWALRMTRLPDAHRADLRLDDGSLTDEPLQAVARRLAAFHERARGSAEVDEEASLARLRAQIELRIDGEAGSGADPLPKEIERIERWQLDFIDAQSARLRRRARDAAIREGHGELSLDHLFVDEAGKVQILAGLEMGPRVRNADVTADVALLATDLASRHRVDLAERVVADYARLANDFDLYPLLDFHSSLRASLRGKLAWFCAHRTSSNPSQADLYRARARRFFALALAAPRRPLLPSTVVAMGGQVASGKSTVARHIGQRIGAPVVSSDATRDFLLGARIHEDLHEARWEDAYAVDFPARVYDEVLRRAGEVLDSDRPVVIDGCFRSGDQRERARALAERFDRPFLFVETRVDRAIQRERLAERAERDRVEIESWQEIADRLRAAWEPVEELPADQFLALDTSRSLEDNAARIESRLPTWPTRLTG